MRILLVCLSPLLTFAAAAAPLGQSEEEKGQVVSPTVPQWQTTWPIGPVQSQAPREECGIPSKQLQNVTSGAAVLTFLSGLRSFRGWHLCRCVILSGFRHSWPAGWEKR